MRTLAEETGAALRATVAGGTGDWRQLWALLCGLALTVPPGDTDSETAKLARETFPDIKDPHVTGAGRSGPGRQAAGRPRAGGGVGHSADGSQATGNPLIACDAYGSRFLLVAPFGYEGEEVDHWYAWDIDACWILTVVGSGVFGSAKDALAEWQPAVGPAAGTALSPCAPEMTAWLLAPCMQTGPLSDMLQGDEPGNSSGSTTGSAARQRPRPLRRCPAVGATAASAAAISPGDDDLGPAREVFLGWYAARHGDVPQDTADAVDTILHEWGPQAHPGERSRYACSPHRIEMAARLIRDGYIPGYANAALRLLPEWTQWCIGQSGLNGDLAAPSRTAALTEAAALVDEETNASAVGRDEAPFRRHE